MWPDLIVINSPSLDNLPGVFQAYKPVYIQAFIPKSAVEALDKCILNGLSRADEIEFDPLAVSPLIQSLTGKLRPVIYGDDLPGWKTTPTIRFASR